MNGYTDFIETMVDVSRDGETASKLVLTDESTEEFLIDEKLSTELAQEKKENFDEFSVSVVSGDEDYIVTESGKRYTL
jgi:hypothetical protein